MTTKIKEFRGSLKPIFHEDALIESLIDETKTPHHAPIIKNHLAINLIKARANQPRKIFNETALQELTQSIKSQGVIQPIIVRPIDAGHYEIVVGERRWRAAQRAGLEEIPVIIKDYNKQDQMAVALIENIQRENLNPLEEAQAIEYLLIECQMTHVQIAQCIGKSRTTVTNLLRLLNLQETVKTMINSGALEMGHARALLSLETEQQLAVAKIVLAKKLSVRATEKLVQNINQPRVENSSILPPEFRTKTQAWQRKLAKKLPAKVDVDIRESGQGRVVIHFDSITQAQWLMEHLVIK